MSSPTRCANPVQVEEVAEAVRPLQSTQAQASAAQRAALAEQEEELRLLQQLAAKAQEVTRGQLESTY